MPAILVALLTGVFMVFLGGYIPAARAQGLSQLSRVKKRKMVGELISDGDVTGLTLPIRINVQNGDMLYTYVGETIGKFTKSLVDAHSVKGELYRDGTFRVSFVARGEGDVVTIPCEIKGIKKGEILIPVRVSNEMQDFPLDPRSNTGSRGVHDRFLELERDTAEDDDNPRSSQET